MNGRGPIRCGWGPWLAFSCLLHGVVLVVALPSLTPPDVVSVTPGKQQLVTRFLPLVIEPVPPPIPPTLTPPPDALINVSESDVAMVTDDPQPFADEALPVPATPSVSQVEPLPNPTPPLPEPPANPLPREDTLSPPADPLTTPTQPAAPATPMTEPGGETVEPTTLVNPAPRYPRSAIRRGLEGVVWLRVLLNADGRPTHVELDTTSGFAVLDQAALRTVRDDWRFSSSPSTTRETTIRITFSLQE